MINIAVVDDEEIIREQIKGLIEKQQSDFVVEEYVTGNQLLGAKKYFDVIFLDIQMEGINGIDTARNLRKQQKESILIFITGMKEYVFEVFDVSAFHYLLKPVEEEKFSEVFERAVMEVERRKKQRKKQVFIKTKNRNIILNQNKILYIENRLKKVEIHTNTEVIELYASMRELEQQLGDNFYRCHRGFLVNMAYIAEYRNTNIILNNGEELLMAKEKYNEFVKNYMRYLRSGGIACV